MALVVLGGAQGESLSSNLEATIAMTIYINVVDFLISNPMVCPSFSKYEIN